jgi:hypothetical protein
LRSLAILIYNSVLNTYSRTPDVALSLQKAVKYQGKHVEHSQTDIPDDRFDLMTAIIASLQPQESVSRALIRLGGGQQGKQRRKARPAKSSSAGAVGDAKAVEHLTSLANALMTQGVYDVYDVRHGQY